MITMNAPRISPLLELRNFLARLAADYRRTRSFACLLKVEVASDITADVILVHRRARQSAHASEVYDLEASKIISEVLADGVITPDELPKLHRARRLVNRSAEADHDISEQLTG
jgi:hypothetical protein